MSDSMMGKSGTSERCALGVMTKAPQPGSVKTRLVPPLTHEEAAALSLCFLKDTFENIAEVSFNGNAAGVAVYTPRGGDRAFDGLWDEGLQMLLQRGEDFGERLFHASEDLLAMGFTSLCLIDSDSPTLPTARLNEAIAALQMPGDRVVLGPADDGGYYLIGMSRAHSRLFEGIDWSTSKVLTQTIDRANELCLEVVLLEPHFDVDDGATLEHLCEELFEKGAETKSYPAQHTRAWLTRILKNEGLKRIWPSKRHPTIV